MLKATVIRKKGKRSLEDVTKTLTRKMPSAVMAVAKFLNDESDKLVPTDTTALLESGKHYLLRDGIDAVAVVGYGSPDDQSYYSSKDGKIHRPHEYAVFVHNVPAYHNHGQHDFLRTPYNSLRREMAAIFRLEMSR